MSAVARSTVSLRYSSASERGSALISDGCQIPRIPAWAACGMGQVSRRARYADCSVCGQRTVERCKACGRPLCEDCVPMFGPPPCCKRQKTHLCRVLYCQRRPPGAPAAWRESRHSAQLSTAVQGASSGRLTSL